MSLCPRCMKILKDEEFYLCAKCTVDLANESEDKMMQEWFDSYENNDDDEMKITVIIRMKDGSTKTIKGKIEEIVQEDIE